MNYKILNQDFEIAKLAAQANAEIAEWLKTGKIPHISDDTQEYLNSLVQQQIMR